MRWTERQRAMLAEMGLRAWPQAEALAGAGAGERADDDAHADAVGDTPVWPESPTLPSLPTLPTLPPAQVAEPIAASARVAEPPPLGARATGVAGMDWPALRAAVEACTACKLCRGRTQTVFGVGATSAHWMVVGEAPGEQEDRQGEPFVGRSGQLLDSMLRSIGLSRAETPGADPARQVYIANTLKCRPPGNRNPEPDELAQCEAFLIRQVELLRPRIILAMGRFAVQSLLRSHEPVGRLRGRVHTYQGVPLVVTYHPAYLLRNLEDKARAWDDLCLAAETVERMAQREGAAPGATPGPA